MGVKNQKFLVVGLLVVLFGLLTGCGGGGGRNSTPTPTPWDPVDPDPEASQVEAVSDYFGVAADRGLTYYKKVVYQGEAAYTYGSLEFSAEGNDFYYLEDELALFLDNITHTTYQYIQLDENKYYVLEEATESPSVVLLNNPVGVDSTSDIWGDCALTEDVTIPVFEGSNIVATYNGCSVFETIAEDCDGSGYLLTIKVWFAPNIGIVKKEEIITDASNDVYGSSTWYLYGQTAAVEGSTLKKASLKANKNQAVIDEFNELINKSWQKL